MRRFIVGLMIVVCALAGLLSAPTTFAAPKTAMSSPAYWVTGSAGTLTDVAISSAFQQSGMTFFKLPQAYQDMTQIHYYLVHPEYGVDGRWHYRFSVHMAPGIAAEWVEVGHNATTRVHMIAVGIAPHASAQPLTNTGVANLASVVYDPANLQLVQVFDYLTYYWDGTCVTNISAHFPNTILYPDGWYIGNQVPSSGNGCGGGYAETSGIYVNLVFCAPIHSTTIVYFTPQSEGLYNGNRYYNNDFSTSGTCGGLLHPGQHWN